MNAATAKKKGLGKGLSALIQQEYSQGGQGSNPTVTAAQPVDDSNATGPQPQTGTPFSLPVDALQAGIFQPRTHFSEEYLHELADSIEKNGIMQPILVRRAPENSDRYEIIAGERRWRAAQLAKLEVVPVIVRELDDQQALELALVENIQRQDLNPLEEAAGYQRLIDEFSYTQEDLAGTIGKSRSHIANLLRLLQLPNELKELVNKRDLSMGHARALLNAKEPEKLAKMVIDKQLSVRQTEALVRDVEEGASAGATPKAPRKNTRSASADHKDEDIIALEESLSSNLGLKVSINDHGGQTGTISISYESLSQLDEVLRRLSDSI